MSDLRRRAALAATLLQAEGAGSLTARLADRWREVKRRWSFRRVSAGDLSQLAAPPVLNVLPTAPAPRLGGVQTQLLRRLAVEERRRPWALLYPQGGRWRLEVCAGQRRAAAAFGACPTAGAPRLRDDALTAAIAQATDLLGCEAVHFEGVAGLALESLAELAEGDLRLLLTLHDFALFCPRPHLLEEPWRCFCRYSTEAERCRRCLAQSWSLAADYEAAHRAAGARLLAAAEAVVYPSPFLRRRHHELFPTAAQCAQRVIEPGTPGPWPPSPAMAAGPIHHLAFAGAARSHKGIELFERLVGALNADPPWPGEPLLWSVFGGGDTEALRRLRRQPRLTVHGYYRSGSLPDLLTRHQVDLVVLPSICPESYGLVYDECWRAGVPVVAFAHGALEERIRRHGRGLLVPPGRGGEGMIEVVRALVRGEQPPLAAGEAPATTERAAAAHLELYAGLVGEGDASSTAGIPAP